MSKSLRELLATQSAVSSLIRGGGGNRVPKGALDLPVSPAQSLGTCGTSYPCRAGNHRRARDVVSGRDPWFYFYLLTSV